MKKWLAGGYDMCIRLLVGPVMEYHSGPPVIQYTLYSIQYSTVYSIQYMCIRVLVGPVIEYHSGPPVIQYTPIHYSIQFTEFGTAADFKNRLALKTQHKK